MLLDHMLRHGGIVGSWKIQLRELLEAKRNTESLSLSPEINQLVIRDKCLYERIPISVFILWFLVVFCMHR